MPRPVYKTKAEIPVGFEDEYEEKEGQWHPKPIAPASDTSKLQAALDAEREKFKAERKVREAAEKEAAELKLSTDALKKGVTEEELRRIREEAEKAAAPDKAKIAALEAENRKLKHTDRLRTLALKAGVMEDRIDAAMLVLEARTELDGDGGIVVKDKAGQKTAVEIGAFLDKEFKGEAAYFYKGTNSAGSGSTGSDGGAAGTADAQAAEAVKAGKAAAAEQKKTIADNSLAFR
jgi:hypothetical protein